MFIQQELQVGTEYSRLENLLAEGNWQQADQETMDIILKLSGRATEGYPKPSDIKKIPAADIKEIDRLWRTYSQGKFGFTSQKHIWLQASQNYTEFCEFIHWLDTPTSKERGILLSTIQLALTGLLQPK